MEAVKAYRPESRSLGSSQVLTCPYSAERALVVIKEMADSLALELLEKGVVTDRIVMSIGYDVENLSGGGGGVPYTGETHVDRYGRRVPKPSHGSLNLGVGTSSSRRLIQAAEELFRRLVHPGLLVRRLSITANHVVSESRGTESRHVQLDLFADSEHQSIQERESEAKERRMQETIIELKKRFGKNAILKGLNFQDGATGRERNSQIGGHKA